MEDFTGAVFAILIIVLAAYAWYTHGTEHTQIGQNNVNMPLMHDTCSLEKKMRFDSVMLSEIERSNSGNHLLLAFMDCEALKARRDSRGRTAYVPGYSGQIISSPAGEAAANKYTRASYVQAVLGQYGTQEDPQKVIQRGEDMLKAPVDPKEEMAAKTLMVGVIMKEKDFFQIATIGLQPMMDGTMGKIINVITVTKLGVPVTIYLQHAATPGFTFQDVSDEAAAYARQLISANPESLSLLFEKSPAQNQLLMLASGAGAVLLAGWFLFFRRRKAR